jgi:hypothetical protein
MQIQQRTFAETASHLYARAVYQAERDFLWPGFADLGDGG